MIEMMLYCVFQQIIYIDFRKQSISEKYRNKIQDGAVVYYINPNIVDGDGTFLAKKDVYNGRGEYVGSGLTWFVNRPTGKEIEESVKEFMKKETFEFLPK